MDDPLDNPKFEEKINELIETVEGAIQSKEEEINSVLEEIASLGYAVDIVCGYTWEQIKDMERDEPESKNKTEEIPQKTIFKKRFTLKDIDIAHQLCIRIEADDIERQLIEPLLENTAIEKYGKNNEWILNSLLHKLAPMLSTRKKICLVNLINADPALSKADIKFNKNKINTSDGGSFIEEMERVISLASRGRDTYQSVKIIFSVFLMELNQNLEA